VRSFAVISYRKEHRKPVTNHGADKALVGNYDFSPFGILKYKEKQLWGGGRL
jgi:hypothetical protein